jgi:heterodisulfide reductase subunit D
MSHNSSGPQGLLSSHERLEHINRKKRQLMSTCTACGLCLKGCPVFTQGKYKDQKPRQIMLKVHDLINNNKYSEEAAYTVLTCTGCGECTSRCPENLIPLLIFRAGIEKLSELGKAPAPVSDFTQLLSALQIKASDVSWLDKAPQGLGPVDVVMFPGCDSIRAPHEIFTHIDILEKMNINFITLWNEDLCCGFKGYWVNDFEKGDQLGKNLISAIEAFKPKTLLLPCAQCYFQFDRILSKLFSFSFEFIYFPKFLFKNLDKIKFNQEINKVITYHDSCKIARGVRDFDTTRELLKKIPGIKLVEMERHKENSICCGGVKNFSYPELTAKLGKKRLDQAEQVSADILVTDCTLCYSILATREDYYPFTVKHYSALIAEGMNIEPRDDTYKAILHENRENILNNAREGLKFRGMTLREAELELDKFLNVVKTLRSKTKEVLQD